jgi:hypothetical protein
MMQKSTTFTTIFRIKNTTFITILRVKECYFHYDMQKTIFLTVYLIIGIGPTVQMAYNMNK